MSWLPVAAAESCVQVVVSVGDGWEDGDGPLSFQFGVAAVETGGKSGEVQWFPREAATRRELYLAAAIPKTACGREAWEVALSVCDAAGACSETRSAAVAVLPLSGTEEKSALEALKTAIDVDLEAGDDFGAWQKAETLKASDCGSGKPSSSEQSLRGRIATKLLQGMGAESERDEVLSALSQTTSLLSGLSASNEKSVKELRDEILRVTRLLISPSNARKRRKKRASAAEEDVFHSPASV